VYRRGGQPQEWSIRDIAVGKHFYGREGDLNADPAITAEEAKLAPLVDELRTRPDGAHITDPAVASLIAHLSLRTRHFRDSIYESTDLFLDEIGRHLSDPENLKAYILTNPETMREALEKEFTSRKVPRNQRKLWTALALKMMPTFLEQQAEALMFLARFVQKAAAAALPRAVRNGHIKALASTPIPEPRAEEYLSLRWFVCHSPSPLIFGDVGCLFRVSGQERYRSFTFKDDRIEAASLPVSSERMLVGTRAGSVPEVDLDALTQAHAAYSRDFLVCSERCERMDSLALNLGSEPGLLSDEEMRRMLKELLSNRGITP